ncbi:MAG: succinate dehydrogenase, cytochrome b556 subunit [Chromatiales bacterium]|nr:succinate dehydrogenase, cytochrome b556 subunit [Chromatiales bacterium]
MAQPDRPLSPHLGIYRWQVSNTLSILHRITGVGLGVGLLLLVTWLAALAGGPQRFAGVMGFLAGPVGLLLLAGFSFCFFYHLANGIRHLMWDAGRGFEPAVARRSGWFTVSAAAVLTVLLWLLILVF